MTGREQRWWRYYQNTQSNPPHPLLIKAALLAQSKDAALDLGSGALQDSKYLIEQGFRHVTALDFVEFLAEIAPEVPELDYKISTFDTFDFPAAAYDLINAHYSLPFNPPQTFDGMFSRLKASLKPDGIFVGQLFGVNDERSTSSRMTFHTREQAEQLMDDLEIVHLEEIEKDGCFADGSPNHWHQFDVIARKQQPD